MRSEEQFHLKGPCIHCGCMAYEEDGQVVFTGPDDHNCELEREEEDDYKCSKCGWHGTAEECENPHDDDYTEYLCPHCKVDCEIEEGDTCGHCGGIIGEGEAGRCPLCGGP